MGDRLGVGNAAFLAAELGLDKPALKFEPACSGSLVGLELASVMAASGLCRRVLVA